MEMEIVIAIAIALAITSLIVAVIVADRRAKRKRTEGLQAAAATMNFTFSPEDDSALRGRLAGFHLFSQGRSRRVRNVLRGRAGDMDVLVFDYRYTTGSGKNSHTWEQTVMLFESTGTHFPDFSLRPEHIFHKLGEVFGFQDIDFDSHPEFSKRYLLKGSDEQQVRNIFTSDVLSFYETQERVSSEAAGGQFIYYRAGKRVAPDKVTEFITAGVRAFSLFKR
jgi:hypothetical protein